MKKLFIILSLFCIFTAGLFADENKSKFSISSRFGVMNGTIGEYVFSDYCLNTDNEESYLNWKIENIPVLTVDLNYNIYKNIFFGAAFTVGFPKKSGHLQDYDWLNSVDADWYGTNPRELTNYSIHDNKVCEYFNSDFSVGYLWQFSKKHSIIPYVQYSLSHIMFEGTDGFSCYKSYNFLESSFSGRVISYKINSNSFFVGIGYKTDIIPFIDFKINLLLSPFACFVNCYDYHWCRDLLFFDNITKTIEYKGSLNIIFRINRKNRIGFWGNIDYIPLAKGTDASKKINNDGEPLSKKWSWADKTTQSGYAQFIWSWGIEYCLSL